LLLLGFATPSAASCGLDLNAVYNGSQPLTLYFPAQVIWTPHFKLQVGGRSIADFDTLCPRWTRNMEMTTPDGGLVMRTEADFGIFTSWFTSGSVVNVYDCNNQYLGQVGFCVALLLLWLPCNCDCSHGTAALSRRAQALLLSETCPMPSSAP